MYQINTLYTLNLQNVICQIYFHKKVVQIPDIKKQESDKYASYIYIYILYIIYEYIKSISKYKHNYT